MQISEETKREIFDFVNSEVKKSSKLVDKWRTIYMEEKPSAIQIASLLFTIEAVSKTTYPNWEETKELVKAFTEDAIEGGIKEYWKRKNKEEN